MVSAWICFHAYECSHCTSLLAFTWVTKRGNSPSSVGFFLYFSSIFVGSFLVWTQRTFYAILCSPHWFSCGFINLKFGNQSSFVSHQPKHSSPLMNVQHNLNTPKFTMYVDSARYSAADQNEPGFFLLEKEPLSDAIRNWTLNVKLSNSRRKKNIMNYLFQY